MKYFLMLITVFCFSAFSAEDDVVGKWAWSGVGCIDESLDIGTFRSKNPAQFEDAGSIIFTFKSDGRAQMNTTDTLTYEDTDLISDDNGNVIGCEKTGEWKTKTSQHKETGSYRVSGNRIIIPEYKGSIIHLVDGVLFISLEKSMLQREKRFHQKRLSKKTEENRIAKLCGKESKAVEKIDELLNMCGSGEVFVTLYDKI